MSIDSNTVTISCPLITDIAYIPNSFMVSEGEDSSPPPVIEQSGAKWTITILANRQKTSLVAQSFNAAVGGYSGGVYHCWSADAVSDPEPSELNFYFGLTVTFATTGTESVTLDIYLGQGNTGFPAYDNNWWIGGQYVSSAGQQTSAASLTVLGTLYGIIGDTSSFSIPSDC